MQQNLRHGGLAIHNLTMYYHAAILTAVCDWWDTQYLDQAWQTEQSDVDIPLCDFVERTRQEKTCAGDKYDKEIIRRCTGLG